MIWSLILFQELVVCFTLVFASEEDSLSRSEYFTTQENKHLAGLVVQRLQSSNLMSCNHICMRTSWCTSTNFKESCNVDDKGSCELNKHELAPIDVNNKLIDQPDVTFSAFLKGCLLTGCLNGGSCSFNEKQETFTCSCQQQWIGDRCEIRIMGCPSGWAKHGLSCYYIEKTQRKRRWSEARSMCNDMAGDLAIIKSAEENNFIFNKLVKKANLTGHGPWIGLYQKNDTKFYWIDGTPIATGFTAWAGGEPNNVYPNGGINCVYMKNWDEGRWDDMFCDLPNQFQNNAPVPLCQRAVAI